MSILCAVDWGAASRSGQHHGNEDRWGATGTAFVLADGMGGHRHGALAATLAVEAFIATISCHALTPASVAAAVEDANAVVREQVADDPTLAGMGCTLCTAVLNDGELFVANVGDSRLYRLRDGRCEQLTSDDSVLSQLAADGLVNPTSAGARQLAGALTRCIGGDATVEVHAAVYTLLSGDRLVLCSDGVHTAVEGASLARAGSVTGAAEAALALIHAATTSGTPRDDATAVVVDVGSRPCSRPKELPSSSVNGRRRDWKRNEMTDANSLTVRFVATEMLLEPGEELLFGRAGELRLDEGDDPYLHRTAGRFLWLRDMWWLENLGTSIDILIRGTDYEDGPRSEKWVRCGRPPEPLTLSAGVISLRSGVREYEIEFNQSEDPIPSTVLPEVPAGADDTWDFGVVPLGGMQRLLLAALAEPRMRVGAVDAPLPSNDEVARRLGWSTTTFNRRLDGLCVLFTTHLVRGLVGTQGHKANHRRENLVNHVISKQMITKADLKLLP